MEGPSAPQLRQFISGTRVVLDRQAHRRPGGPRASSRKCRCRGERCRKRSLANLVSCLCGLEAGSGKTGDTRPLDGRRCHPFVRTEDGGREGERRVAPAHACGKESILSDPDRDPPRRLTVPADRVRRQGTRTRR